MAPKSLGRILRIDEADTNGPSHKRLSRRAELRKLLDEANKAREKLVATKPCDAPGCGGTMHFHGRLEEADAPHTLEGPWYASWRCDKASEHQQLISHEAERELRITASRAFDRHPAP